MAINASRSAVTGSGTAVRLSGLGELFGATWEAYRHRAELLLLLMLFTAYVLLVVGILFFSVGVSLSESSPEKLPRLIIVGSITGSFFLMVIIAWSIMASLIAVVDPAVDMREALAQGWKKTGPIIWFLSIAGFIITGGFLLLIIPGFLFLVWFAFGQYVLAAEDVRGVKALLKSRAYVRGFGGAVFFRLFIVWILSIVIGIVPVVGPLLSILFAPFFMLYLNQIYQQLRGIKGEVSYSESLGARTGWVLLGASGYIVTPVVIAALLATMFSGSLSLLTMMLRSPLAALRPAGAPGHAAPGPSSAFPARDGKQPDATGEAVVIRDGAREIFPLATGFFSETRFADPKKASVQFQFPGPEHSNARRIELILDATKKGNHYADGKAINDSMFKDIPVKVGEQTDKGSAAIFRFVADGGQVFPPKDGCTIVITSPYDGTAQGRFAGIVSACLVHSAGIDSRIESVEFQVKGVSLR